MIKYLFQDYKDISVYEKALIKINIKKQYNSIGGNYNKKLQIYKKKFNIELGDLFIFINK